MPCKRICSISWRSPKYQPLKDAIVHTARQIVSYTDFACLASLDGLCVEFSAAKELSVKPAYRAPSTRRPMRLGCGAVRAPNAARAKLVP